MSLKSSDWKMRRGFMCHSQASTAVCMSTRDPPSVLLPKRLERTVFLDDTRLINYAKYSKLVEPPRSNPVPKIKLRVQDQDQAKNQPKELLKTDKDNNVFQVSYFSPQLAEMQMSFCHMLPYFMFSVFTKPFYQGNAVNSI